VYVPPCVYVPPLPQSTNHQYSAYFPQTSWEQGLLPLGIQCLDLASRLCLLTIQGAHKIFELMSDQGGVAFIIKVQDRCCLWLADN
jgi:hypothetical protein